MKYMLKQPLTLVLHEDIMVIMFTRNISIPIARLQWEIRNQIANGKLKLPAKCDRVDIEIFIRSNYDTIFICGEKMDTTKWESCEHQVQEKNVIISREEFFSDADRTMMFALRNKLHNIPSEVPKQVTRLLPDAVGTTCGQRFEKVFGTEHSHILRVPFRTEKGINFNEAVKKLILYSSDY